LPSDFHNQTREYLKTLIDKAYKVKPFKKCGRVTQVVGLTIESKGPEGFINELCYIKRGTDSSMLPAEIVGFKNENVLLMPLGAMGGVGPNNIVFGQDTYLEVGLSEDLRGRILDGLGNPLDGKNPITPDEKRLIYNYAPHPLKRGTIKEVLPVGIRAIDGLITLGKGQRIGVFAGSGVGKSTLMGMIARNTTADINVISLVGERGREVKEFIERDLREGIKNSILVVATSDMPALVRIKSAFVATTIAEYFRDKGYDVLLMMDSITRLAMSQREVGLAIGEPPTTRGYTPSVFSILPSILERAGMSKKGSITGIYTVLVEADDFNEPISDAIRGIVDGHIILSRALAASNHYPAIDVLQSVSRLMSSIATSEHKQAAGTLRKLMSAYEDSKDLINIGAYVKGSNSIVDEAISKKDLIDKFLKQEVDEHDNFQTVIEKLKMISQG
jgi:flagellum-specific ATP synthase